MLFRCITYLSSVSPFFLKCYSSLKQRNNDFLHLAQFQFSQQNYFHQSSVFFDIQNPQIRPHIARDKKREKEIIAKIRKIKSGKTESTESNSNPSSSLQEYLSSPFAQLKLIRPLLRALHDMNYKIPTPIQKDAIIPGIRGRNVVASAKTGTGKTAAYALPLIQRVHHFVCDEQKKGNVRVAAPLGLVICPTRELVEQVCLHITQFAKYLPQIRVVGIYGAVKNIEAQIEEVKKGVDILIATPGRLLTLVRGTLPQSTQLSSATSSAIRSEKEDDDIDDLIDEKEFSKLQKLSDEELEAIMEDPFLLKDTKPKPQQKWSPPPRGPDAVVDLSKVKSFVLDEVDKMFQMGHFPDVKTIFTYLPKPQKGKETNKMQVTMMSATLVPQITELVQRFAPEAVTIDLNEDMQAAESVKNIVYLVTNRRKYALLRYLLKRKGSMKGKQCLIFCRTKQRVNRLSEALKRDNFAAEGIHRDLSLKKRQKIIESFTKGEIQCLVSTEVMARGIDVPGLPFVVNFDVPFVPEEFVHRIGRTGRAGNQGTAITFVGREPIVSKLGGRVTEINEMDYLRKIEGFMKKKLTPSKVPGPWSDDGFNENFALEMKKLKLLQEEQKILKKQENKEEKQNKSKNDPATLLSRNPQTKKTETSVPIDQKIEEKKEKYLEYLINKRKRILKHAIQNKVKPKDKQVLDAKRILKKEEVGLRDFREGRFEEVVKEFERRSARKRGVAVPQDFDERIRKIARKAKREKRKKKEKIKRDLS